MTFNSSQQERLLAALERIADALEQQARPAPAWGTGANDMTDPHSTKGPYR